MPIRVLIIDDDHLVHTIVRQALEPNGFKVESADEGESGIKKALDIVPDIILLDVEMPGANGYQVCEELRGLPETEETPIVFLSGHGSLQQRMQGYEAGADDYLTKPFESQDLVARLRVLGSYHRDRHELRNQYRLAQATVHSALTGTSEIGVAMAYMEKTIGYTTVEDTIEGLLETADRLDLDIAVRVDTNTGHEGFASEGTISPLEQELLDMSNRERRFMDFGCRTLVHFSAITILIKNMPLDNMERYGRIKDLVPLLLSAANTRLSALTTRKALVDQSDDLKHAFNGIRKNLFKLAELIVTNRKRGAELMAMTIQDLSIELMRMSLEEDQEKYLLDKIESSITSSLDELDVGCEIKESLSFVLESLEETMSTHDDLLDAFISGQEKLLNVVEQTDDSIELFE